MKFPQTGRGASLRTTLARGCAVAAVSVPLLAVLPQAAFAQWESAGSTWRWKEDDGSYRKSSWLHTGGAWYRFDAEGTMVTGWYDDAATRYWFGTSGAMAVGWRQIDGTWYWFDPSGAMATGWRQVGSTWYWFEQSGAMGTGWHRIGDAWYRFDPSGAMVTGWQQVDGQRYWFNASGAMAVGWRQIDGSWYWFEPSGAMAQGLREVNGTSYLFLDDGRMSTGIDAYQGSYYVHNADGTPVVGWWQEGASWYCCDGQGLLYTGWQRLGGSWYYFCANGAMARVSWVDDCYLGDSGVMATNVWVGDRYVGADGRWQKDKAYAGEPRVAHTTELELWGVDLSSHNHSAGVYDRYLNATENAYLQTDFAIVKATQGGFDGYRNPYFGADVERALADDKVVGIYHYVTDEASPEEQAEAFFEYFEPYVGEAFAVVDWEGYLNESNWGHNLETGWLKRFAERFWDLCGVTPVLYTGASAVNSGDFADVADLLPLWVAGYKYVPGTESEYETFELPRFIWYPLAGWEDYDIWQYTSSNGKIDRNYTALGREGLAALGSVAPQGAGRWIKASGKWWYREHSTGAYPRDGWFDIEGKAYHFDAFGWLSVSWLKDGDDWYYLGDSGEKATGWQTIDGARYHFDDDGVMDHDTVVDGVRLGSDGAAVEGSPLSTSSDEGGWSLQGGTWYYYDDAESWAANAWRAVDGSWYRFDGTGALLTGWFPVDGWWYHANSQGKMDTGWITDGWDWYYLGSDGWMRTGWFQDPDGWWYHANSQGRMDTGWITDGWDWYYLGSDGWMRTGWRQIGGSWYWFYPTGEMAYDTEVDGYYLDANGIYHSSRQDFIDEWTRRIDAYLEGTATEGCGVYYATAAYDYDVDPRILPAVSGIESGWGRHCFTDYNAWGWFSTLGNSWAESIDIITRQFSRGYGHDFDWDEIVAYVGSASTAAEWQEILEDQMALI